MSKRVFLSYKWETPEHNAWVEKFYRDLRFRGVDAKIDQFEVAPGDSFIEYMTKGIREADCVLFIVTPGSVESLEKGTGSVSFEIQISTAIRNTKGSKFPVIPVLKEGDYTSTYFADRRYFDLRDPNKYYESLNILVKWINEEMSLPQLGVDLNDADSIKAALPSLRMINVTGWAEGDPENGNTGRILLEWGKNPLIYIRKDFVGNVYAHRDEHTHWGPKWHKDFFSWTLKWDDNLGVIAVGRMAISPD
jgi:hypothetical protein